MILDCRAVDTANPVARTCYFVQPQTTANFSQMPPEQPMLAICPKCRELKGRLVRRTKAGDKYECRGCFCIWIAADPEPIILNDPTGTR